MTHLGEEHPLQIGDPGLIGGVRDVLDRAGYTWPGVRDLLGSAQDQALKFDRRAVPRLLRRCAGGSLLQTFVRVFLLGTPIEEGRLRSAVAPMRLEDWVGLGLLEPTESAFRSPVRITPSDELLLVQESPWKPASQAVQVMPISGSTTTLAQLMIRRPVRAALDIGTGCGVLALLAALRSEQAVGTDCSPRALNVATFNAHLNRLTSARFLEGDLFEPVEGQSFDLVLANLPYVISPDRRFLFQDSGLPGDEISARAVRAAPRFLRPGGYAQILINWAHVKGEDWRERLRGWLAGSDCAAWLLRFETVSPEDYAVAWLPGENDPLAHGRRFEEWMAYYERQGIEAIGSGMIALRRQPSGPTWFAFDDGPKEIGPCGEAVVLGFAQRDFLVRHPDEVSLLAARYQPNPALQGEHRLRVGPQGWQLVSSNVNLAGGLAFALTVEGVGMDVLNRIRPDRPLGAILDDLAAHFREEPARIRAAALPFIRCLIEEGFLLPVEQREPGA